MKQIRLAAIICAVFFGLTSCEDLDTFVEPEPQRLPALPPDSCGENLMAEASELRGLKWSHDSQEVFFVTYNSIRAVRVSDKSIRTIVRLANSPEILWVSEDGGQVYYVSMDSQTWVGWLFVISTGGSPVRILSGNNVMISSDARTAAFQAPYSDSVYAIDLSTNTVRFLRRGSLAALSGDGSSALIRSYSPPSFVEEAYVVSTTTSASSRIDLGLEPTELAWQFKWVGGELKAYTLYHDGLVSEIRVRTVSTGNVSVIVRTNEFMWFDAASVSNDGTQVAWWATECLSPAVGGCNLQEMNLYASAIVSPKVTTIARAYTRNSLYTGRAAFSYDGKKVAFVVKSGLYVNDVT